MNPKDQTMEGKIEKALESTMAPNPFFTPNQQTASQPGNYQSGAYTHPTPQEQIQPNFEIGKSGTIIVGGIITNADYNADLTGVKAIQIYDEMRKSDPVVNAALSALMLPIMSANWFITPASDKPIDIKAAEHVEKELFEGLDMSWRDFLYQCMLYLVYGRMAFEIVYDQNEDGLIGWKKFAPRLPQTIYRWELPDKTLGIVQMLPLGGVTYIPWEKLLVFVNKKEGDNFEGISSLRQCYRPWYIKKQLIEINALAFERQGLGIPYVVIPKGAPPAEEAKAEELVQNMRANEKGYLKQTAGWEFGFMDMKANGIKNPERTIEMLNGEILLNMFAQFLALGSNKGSGSRAVSQDHSRLMMLTLQSIANYICEIINRNAIQRLVDLNFDVENYPILEVSKIGEIDFTNLSNSILQLSQAGQLTTTPETEDHLRDVMDLPPVTPEERAEKDLNASLDQADQDLQSDDQAMSDVPEGESDQDEESMGGGGAKKATEELLNALKGGVAGVPLSEETKQKIAEALYKGGKKKGTGVKRDPAKTAKIKELRNKLSDVVTKIRTEMLQAKAKGEKISPQKAAQYQLEILKTRTDTNNQIRALQASEHDNYSENFEAREAIAATLGKVEDAIIKLTENS